MSEADTSWDNYFKAVANRPAHATAERAMHALGDRRGTVLDLGAGSGRDALQFLSRGFRVKAIDSHPGTLAELKARAAEAGLGDRLICETRKLEEFEFRDEAYDVINASMSLPFCPPQKFREVWDGIRRSLKPGGIFAGHFFGKNDTWHTGEMTFVWQSELEGLLIGMEILDLTEHELDRDTPTGEHRHWHYFEVVARRSA